MEGVSLTLISLSTSPKVSFRGTVKPLPTTADVPVLPELEAFLVRSRAAHDEGGGGGGASFELSISIGCSSLTVGSGCCADCSIADATGSLLEVVDATESRCPRVLMGLWGSTGSTGTTGRAALTAFGCVGVVCALDWAHDEDGVVGRVERDEGTSDAFGVGTLIGAGTSRSFLGSSCVATGVTKDDSSGLLDWS